MKKLYQDEQWNLFNNMMLTHLINGKLAFVVDESVDREVILSQIQELLPKKVQVPIEFVSSVNEKNRYGYRYVFWDSFVRYKHVKKAYPNLKRVVLDSDLRREFYESKHMELRFGYDPAKGFETMEHAASKFLEDKNMLVDAEEMYESLLKAILIWRNKEIKMGHPISIDVLDKLTDIAGAVPFLTEEGDAYDSNRHEVVSVLPCEEPEKVGLIAEVVSQGYLFQGEVLVKADVKVYK